MGKAEVPPGWVYATVGDVVANDGIFTDGDWVETKDQDPNGGVRLIQLADIGDGSFLDKSSRFLTRAKAYELNCTLLTKGDLLVARMPEPLGRCCIFPLDGVEKYVTVVDVCAVRLGTSSIVPKYVMYVINSPRTRTAIEALKSGSTRKRISRGNFARVEIPLAPQNEQHRIVAKIEELFSELDKGVESLKTARAKLNVYRQAVLKHAFEGKLTAQWREENKDKLEKPERLLARIKQEREAHYERQLQEWKAAVKKCEGSGKSGKKPAEPKKPLELADVPQDVIAKLPHLPEGWLWAHLGDISDVSGGLTKNQKRNSLPRKMKYLRVANVYADEILTDDIHEIGVTDSEAKAVALEAGDLLIVEGNGSIGQIGRVALWDGELSLCGHQNHLIRTRLLKNFLPRFFLQFLLSPLGRDLIVREASSTSGLHTLSISKVSNLVVPVASSAEESAVVAQIEERLPKVDKTLEDIDTQLVMSEALRQSILKKAFTGQLVEQDPDDEPASVLLDRIRAEREKAMKNNHSKKMKKRKTAA